MQHILFLGLFVALFGALIVITSFKLVSANTFSLAPRIALWVPAVTVVAIAVAATVNAKIWLGIQSPSWQGVGLGALAIVVTLTVFATQLLAQKGFAKGVPKQHQQGQKLFELPFAQRCFVVITAAVVEEVLYRGYAIGVGQHLLGGVWLACIVSIAAFTLAHFRWGFAHMVPVAITATIFSLLFVVTQNLLVCIIAHAVVDGAGFLVMPALMARKRVLQSTNRADPTSIQQP